jgi:hypothetical protein
MAYYMRFVNGQDVPDCVEMEPTRFGCQNDHEKEECVRMLHQLLAEGRALATVVCNEEGERIAFGMTIFISDEFRQMLICRWSGFIGSALRRYCNQRTVLTFRAIVQAHRGGGLNMLGFYGWREDLPPEVQTQAQQLLYAGFPYLHRGYHLKSFLKEVYGEYQGSLYCELGMPMYKQPCDYPRACQHKQPYLVGAERGQAAFPRRIADLFASSAPRVHLTQHVPRGLPIPMRKEEIAQLAYLLRMDDKGIAECLGIDEGTVYNYWHRMCHQLRPLQDHFPPLHNSHNGQRTGRRMCLALIAHYPEVIYPLRIHTYFYNSQHIHNHPHLTYQYPLPIDGRVVVQVPARHHAHTTGEC